MRKQFTDKLLEMAGEDSELVLLSGDMGFGMFEKFQETYPDRFINCGISEQNMMSVAAGLALIGKHVVCYSIANFPTLRCLEQIRNDIAYPELKVIIVASGTGVEYGSLGVSHHTTEDIAIMRSIPNMAVYCPCNNSETVQCMTEAMSRDGPSYIRINKVGVDERYSVCTDPCIDEIRHGTDIAIFSCGGIIEEALKATEDLCEVGIYNVLRIKPLDKERLRTCISGYKSLVTLEEGNLDGGFGSAILEAFSDMNVQIPVRRIGLGNLFTEKVGKRSDLFRHYHIDAEAVRSILKSLR